MMMAMVAVAMATAMATEEVEEAVWCHQSNGWELSSSLGPGSPLLLLPLELSTSNSQVERGREG